jgi:acyl-coenzyme A synthetase/AMP-(fatty) acid ligase
VVIVNGKKIDASDIEHELTAVDGLRRGRAVAFPVLQPAVGSYSLALVIEAENASAEMERDLVRRVREYVYNCCAVMPAIIEIRPSGWIVKTTSGKINHKQNRLKFLAETGRVD